MSKKLLAVLLSASLLLNLAVVGGVLYVRYVAIPHTELDAVSARLDLDGAGRAHLLQMRRDIWAGMLESRRDNRVAVLDLNQALTGKASGDPAFASALDELSASRRARQEKMLARVIAFRDSLPTSSREHFELMAKDPQFVLELIGLRVDADAR